MPESREPLTLNMPLLAYGINHRSASLDIREKFVIPRARLPDASSSLRETVPELQEFVIVCTCNRTEVHCVTDRADVSELKSWLASECQLSCELLDQVCYPHWDLEAVRHVMRVGSGLDSLVLGEPQILGQLKSAYAVAQQQGSMGRQLERLATAVWSVAKRVRSQTYIGSNPVSVASTATRLTEQLLPDMGSARVLLLGAGSNVRRLVRHLQAAGCRDVCIANRTLTRAQQLAAATGGTALPLNAIDDELPRFDVVISSTGSTNPMLHQDQVRRAIRSRSGRSVVIIDLGVPRDVEPATAALRGVHLYSIDDLSDVIDINLEERRQAAEQAAELIDQAIQEYERAERIAGANALLGRYRDRNESIRLTLLAAANDKLAAGASAAEVMNRLSKDLTNKLTHGPTMVIREASANGDHRLLELLEAVHTRD